MNTIDTKDTNIEARVAACPEVDFPEHLHGRIMKRVFLAGYGKYLVASGGILLLNLGVLGANLYRSLTSIDASAALQKLGESFAFTPAYFASAVGTLYDILPVQAVVAMALTLALCVYIALVFVRAYRNPAGARLFI